jgi:outer membrane protein
LGADAAVAEPLTFVSLLARALDSEPTYLSAKAGVDAADARVDQNLGTLLPQISINGSINANDRDYKTRSPDVPEQKNRYNSNSAQATLTQALWRYENILGFQQARHVAKQMRYQLSDAEQELFVRLVTAWFEVLSARDEVAFTEQQADAFDLEWKAYARGHEFGDNSLIDVEDARTKLDQALSDRETARAEALIKRAALEQLVGPLEAFDIPFMREEAELAFSGNSNQEAWLQRIEQGNPALLAASRAFEAASAEVGKQRAGHLPTLDLVASYGRNSQREVGNFPGQDGYEVKQGTVGLQWTVPFFSGGTQSGKVKEAAAQREKARLEMDAAHRAAVLAVKQAWFSWQSGEARAHVGNQAIHAARVLMTQAQMGLKQGLGTSLEVSRAERQLRVAQRDCRRARYDQIVAWMRLKAAVGALTASDVAALDALLVATATAGEVERGADPDRLASTATRDEQETASDSGQ